MHQNTKQKGLTCLIIATIALVLCACVAFAYYFPKFMTYHDACQKMESIPLKAQDYFLDLGDFMDSEEKAKECANIVDYQIALDLMEDGEYEKAHELFTQLGDFRESEACAKQCTERLNQP